MLIVYTGSTADCLEFEGMAVYHKLEEEEGFLHQVSVSLVHTWPHFMPEVQWISQRMLTTFITCNSGQKLSAHLGNSHSVGASFEVHFQKKLQ